MYSWGANLPRLFVITPTKARLTQKADLIRLSQTLMNVPDLHWIVVEDSYRTSNMIERLLSRSGLPFTHLAKASTEEFSHGKGMQQRNLGLEWLRRTYRNLSELHAVVYFADDDNTYDTRQTMQTNVTNVLNFLFKSKSPKGTILIYQKVWKQWNGKTFYSHFFAVMIILIFTFFTVRISI